MAAPLYQVQVGRSYSSGFKNGNRSGQDEVYSTIVQVKLIFKLQELMLLVFLDNEIYNTWNVFIVHVEAA